MEPVIVVNKIDLLKDEQELDELQAYHDIEAPLVLCSVKEDADWRNCAACCAGKRVCLLVIAASVNRRW